MLRASLGRTALAAAIVAASCSNDDEKNQSTPHPTTDGGADADAAVVNPPDPFVDGLASKTTVVWFAAHPDDEFSTAPLLGELVERGLKLHIFVVTRGEKTSSCWLDEPCDDIVAIRERELQASAEALGGAQITQLGLPDAAGGSDPSSDPRVTVKAWNGLRPTLVEEIKTFLTSVQPAVVFTFDPREGVSCHPDHRASGYFMVQALLELGAAAPPGFFFASKRSLPFGSVTPTTNPAIDLRVYDATRISARVSPDTWIYHQLVAQAHASQFVNSFVDSISKTVPEERRDYYLPIQGWPSADLDFDRCYVPFGHGPIDSESDAATDAAENADATDASAE